MIARIFIAIISFVFVMFSSFYFMKYHTMYNEIIIDEEMTLLAKEEAASQKDDKERAEKFRKYLEALFVSTGDVSQVSNEDGSVIVLEKSDDLQLKRDRYVKAINELEKRKEKHGIIIIFSSLVFIFSTVSFLRKKYKVIAQ